MFRIRRIYDTVLPVNQQAISQVQAILKSQFPDLPQKDIRTLPDQLTDPFKYQVISF